MKNPLRPDEIEVLKKLRVACAGFDAASRSFMATDRDYNNYNALVTPALVEAICTRLLEEAGE